MTPDIFDRPAYVYKVWSPFCEGVYYGMTLDPRHRWHVHKGTARPHNRHPMRKNPLYVAMREAGPGQFRFTVLKKWASKFDAAAHERELIITAILDGTPLFNKARPKGWINEIMDRARARRKAKGED